MKFLGQRTPFASVGVFNEQHVVGAAADDDLVAGAEFGAGLAVAEKGGAGINPCSTDDDGALSRHDDGPKSKAMRSNRSNAQGIDVGANDRSAGRKVVRGGPAGRGDDQAVAEITDTALAI